MSWNIEVTDQAAMWLAALDHDDYDAIGLAIVAKDLNDSHLDELGKEGLL